MLPNSKQLKL